MKYLSILLGILIFQSRNASADNIKVPYLIYRNLAVYERFFNLDSIGITQDDYDRGTEVSINGFLPSDEDVEAAKKSGLPFSIEKAKNYMTGSTAIMLPPPDSDRCLVIKWIETDAEVPTTDNQSYFSRYGEHAVCDSTGSLLPGVDPEKLTVTAQKFLIFKGYVIGRENGPFKLLVQPSSVLDYETNRTFSLNFAGKRIIKIKDKKFGYTYTFQSPMIIDSKYTLAWKYIKCLRAGVENRSVP